jgi:hypothetical protein
LHQIFISKLSLRFTGFGERSVRDAEAIEISKVHGPIIPLDKIISHVFEYADSTSTLPLIGIHRVRAFGHHFNNQFPNWE